MATSSGFTCKRSTSPIQGPVKRYKSESANSEKCVPYAQSLPLTATYGVEVIKYAPGTRVSAFNHGDFETNVRERKHLLLTQGRRVVGLPLVFDDGIVMHWVSDPHIEGSHEAGPSLSSESLASQKSLDIPPLPELQTSTSGPADVVRRYTDLSDTPGSPEIEIISYKLAGGNEVTKNEHPEECSHKPHTPLKSEATAHDGILKDDRISPSEDIATLSRSRAVPSRRDQDMAELCGDWSSMRSSSVTPSSDDDRFNELADISEVAGASSSRRTEVRTPLARTVGALRGQRPISQRSTAAARSSVSSQPGKRNSHHTSDITTPMEDRRRSTVSSGRSQRAGSLSSESSADQEAARLPALKRVPLPKTPYGRSRRLLIPASDNLPLVAISMRADAQFINRRDQFRLTLNSLPNPGVQQHVEDACVVGDIVVLGFNSGPSQVEFLPVTTDAPRRVSSQPLPHVSSRVSKSSGEGIRCLAAMNATPSSINFFTGGHDRRIFKWTADTRSLEKPTVTKIDVFLDSGVSAMAYRHNDNSLVSSDTKKLYVTDLTRSHTPKPAQVSNDVNQIHIHPQIPHLTLLEVRHLDHQMSIFDCRMGGFDKAPCCTFGYRTTDAKFQQSYTKGSIHHTFFVRGHQDGTVVLWDFRNSKNIVTKRQSQLTKSVVHTVVSDGHVVTFGDGVVTFLNDFLQS